MLCREIIDVIEGTYPKEAALAWDNVGLLVGRTEKEVKRIYVALDATDEIDTALQTGAEVLVTGDIGHHEGIDAVARGLDVIDAGHYGLEHIFIEDMAMFLESHLSCVKIEKAEIVQPFQTV